MTSFQAVIDPPVQEVFLGSSAEFSCIGYDATGHESTRPIAYEWEAAPYIVQEQRYTFSEDKHKLEIYNVQISDNNTAVWCRVDATAIGGGPSNKAKARIVVLPGLPGSTGMGVGIGTQSPSPSLTTLSIPSSPSGRRGTPAGATVAGLLLLLVAFALLLFYGYRRTRHSRRDKHLWSGSKLLGTKSPGSKKPKVARYSSGEDGYQEPVIPAINNPPQYTCLTQSAPINKRPIPPPRTKRGRRNTEPATLCAINEEAEGYHAMRPNSVEPPRGACEHTGYMDMSGKNGKKKNRTLLRPFNQYNPDDDDTDYENVIVKTLGKRNGTHVYVNQNVGDKKVRGHLPSHGISSNYNSNKPHGGSGTLVYASLDLEDVQGGGRVFLPPEVERTTYAKILRILSVFRTMRSTRIRVIHTGADGKHANGECETTRYR